MLVINIPKIPNICGCIFHFSLFTFHLLLVRFSFASNPFLLRSYSHSKWAKNGSYMGLTTDLHGRYYLERKKNTNLFNPTKGISKIGVCIQ